MVESESCLVQRCALDASHRERTSERDSLSPSCPPVIEKNSACYSLKAVYPHFVQGRKVETEHSPDVQRNDLESAMEEAKQIYETMREVQELLNQAYKEINKI